MTQARAVAVILVPPEYRPTDPYPPHAPGDPEWVFESYDDYWWYLETEGPEMRVVIHDPHSGDSQIRRIARPPMNVLNLWVQHTELAITNGAIPMKNGVLFIGEANDGTGEQIISYCRYKGSGDPSEVAPSEILARTPGFSFKRALSEDSVALYASGYLSGESGFVYFITPEPESGQSVVIIIDAPNFIGGGPSWGYDFQVGQLDSQSIEFLATKVYF